MLIKIIKIIFFCIFYIELSIYWFYSWHKILYLIWMCGISAIYILDKKGRVLISRHFRPDLPTNIYDVFNKKILEYDEYSLKYIFIDLGLSSKTRTIISSISTSITISTLSPFLKRIIMLSWFLHFFILL